MFFQIRHLVFDYLVDIVKEISEYFYRFQLSKEGVVSLNMEPIIISMQRIKRNLQVGIPFA